MSILQEYEGIRKQIGEDKYHAIDEYLTECPRVYLSDIYYNEDEWNKFEEWYKAKQMTTKYFKMQFRNLPHIDEYLNILINANVSPYDIDTCLRLIECDMSQLLISSRVGADIANKLQKIKGGE